MFAPLGRTAARPRRKIDVTPARRIRARVSGVLLAGLLACAVSPIVAQPTVAKADPMSELQEVQERVSESNAAYEEATEQELQGPEQ